MEWDHSSLPTCTKILLNFLLLLSSLFFILPLLPPSPTHSGFTQGKKRDERRGLPCYSSIDFILTSSHCLPIPCSKEYWLFYLMSHLFLSLHHCFFFTCNKSISLGSSPILTLHFPLKSRSFFKAQLKYEFCPKVSWICQVRTNHLFPNVSTIVITLKWQVIL